MTSPSPDRLRVQKAERRGGGPSDGERLVRLVMENAAGEAQAAFMLSGEDAKAIAELLREGAEWAMEGKVPETGEAA